MMANEFSILIIITSIVQITLCTFNREAPRTGRRNQLQSQPEDALSSNTGDDNPSMNFNIESLTNQLTSLPPAQIRQLAGLFSPGGAFGSILNGNNVDDRSAEPNEYNSRNNRNNRSPNRRTNRRNARRRSQRRRAADCRRNGELGAGPGYRMGGGGRGEGIGIGEGNGGGGQGYGSGMGYGSGNGMGIGMGEGFGSGNGGGQGYGSGTGIGYGAPGNERAPAYGAPGRVSPGEGGAGGSMFGYGSGSGYANSRQPYDYDDPPASPNVSGTSGAMIGGGSEISGVKINSFARPGNNGIPPRMASGQDRGRRNALLAQREDQGILQY